MYAIRSYYAKEKNQLQETKEENKTTKIGSLLDKLKVKNENKK